MDNAQAHRSNRPGSIRHGIRRPDRTMPHGKQTDPNMRSGWKIAKSIEAKLKLMKKYKLAGTAEWSLGQESSDIWNLIQKYVN